jgi:hypothetical protein
MRIPCTCGCGEQVTYATKIKHNNGLGKTSLRARVLEENESLKRITQQPALLRDHQTKKRSNPSSNQTGNSKRLKVAPLEVAETPLREDADPMRSGSLSPSALNEESEILPEELPLAQEPNSGTEDGFQVADALSFARRSNRIAERTKDITEQRWGNNHLRDEIPGSDHGGGSDRSDDDEDVDLNITGDEAREDDDRKDDDEDREYDDEDDLFESDVTGITAWDQLGEGFEREAASIGMFLAHDSSVLLTIV